MTWISGMQSRPIRMESGLILFLFANFHAKIVSHFSPFDRFVPSAA
jgi:hypothetical protein